MSFIVGLLTFILVINSLLLILLVLIQLPKKDAGAGLAFGSGAADALFGAGSGNALTKITKWAIGVFVLMTLIIGYLQDRTHHDNSAADFTRQVQQREAQIPPATAPTQPAPPPSAPPAANSLLSTIPVAATNAFVDTNSPK